VYAPVAFLHCMPCEFVWRESAARRRDRQEQLETSLPADLQHQYRLVGDWVRGQMAAHEGEVRFRIIDAASVEGWIKSLWYGVRHYPAVIVDRRTKSVGLPLERASTLVAQRLMAHSTFHPPSQGRSA